MCAPSSPDTSRQDAIAAEAQHLSEDQWNWVKQEYDAAAPDRKRAADTAEEVSRAQLAQMGKASALADESAANYRRIYQPLEEQAAREAATYDSEANQQAAAGRALADVRQQAALQRGATERNLASMGVNASDGAFASTAAELANAETLGAAQGANAAREQVKTVGRALRQDAIGVGRGVVGSQGTQAGLALTAGGQAAGTAQIPVQNTNAGIQVMGQASGQAVNGLMGAANIYQNSSAAKAQADQASAAGLGSLAGAGMTAAAIF